MLLRYSLAATNGNPWIYSNLTYPDERKVSRQDWLINLMDLNILTLRLSLLQSALMSRYHVAGSEGKFEKDSGEQVMANKLGLTDSTEMNEAELVLLEQLYQSVFEENFPEGKLNVALLKSWHRRWLGNIYAWAGQERTVNISKGGFMFAPSAQLPKLLNEYNKYLAHYTPCNDMDEEELIIAIAVTHVELILIHPFREGNGRLSRLLADVMAVQGGYKPLDYQSWEQNKTQYISAIHAGMSMDYAPMKYWVSRALRRH